MMEKESLMRFVSHFEAIDSAATLLKGKTPDIFTIQLIHEIEKCSEIQKDQNLLQNAIFEIERNLYNFKEQELRIIYIKDVLRLFVNYAPFLDFETKTERTSGVFVVGERIVPRAKYTLAVIESYRDDPKSPNAKRYSDMNQQEQYIVDCFTMLLNFGSLLDAKCLSFNIDLLEVQKEAGIFIQRNRRWDILSYYGFKQNEFNSKQQQPDNQIQDEGNRNEEIETINGLASSYDQDQLSKIFDNLILRNVTKADDKILFLSFFKDKQKGRVFWNSKIHGAKAGLFDLMERITGKSILESELRNYFEAGESIHRKWRDKTGANTRLIDKITDGI